MSKTEPRPCPVCGGLGRHIIHRQRLLDGPLGGGYDVVVCTRCGAGFADGIPAQGVLDRHYSEHSKYSYDHAGGAESPWDLKRFEETVGQARRHLRARDARILDIGCATGGLLAAFRARGFPNVTGADPSPACAAAARRLYGLDVRTATLGEMRGWTERFDLVALVGVLEHVREARDALEVVKGLLMPGGLVYCAVPDVEGLAECFNAPYQQFSTEHVNFFSSLSLDRLFAGAGMAPVESWRWTVEWRGGVTEPIVSAVYGPAPPRALDADSFTRPALERYVAVSKAGDAGIISTIESLRTSQEPVVVWGAGTLARRLLATTRLAEVNIQAFVDSSPHLQGGRLANSPIVPWASVEGLKRTVLICSITFEKEIAESIRGQSGYPGRIISLSNREIPR
jgi:SAM-dependent methyltransferase